MERTTNRRVPIREWRLSNFKSVQSGAVEFAPLTVLVGANSSGKSSLIQSILLISQAARPGEEGNLPLGGPLIELGDIYDVLHASYGEAPEAGKRAASAFSIGGTFDLAGYGPPLRSTRVAGVVRALMPVRWDAEFVRIKDDAQRGSAKLLSAQLAVTTNMEAGTTIAFQTLKAKGQSLPVLPPRSRFGTAIQPLRGNLVASGTRIARTAGLVQVAGIPQAFLTECEAIAWLSERELRAFLRPPRELRLTRDTSSSHSESDAELILERIAEHLSRVVSADLARYGYLDSPGLREVPVTPPPDLPRDVSRILLREKKEFEDLRTRILNGARRIVNQAIGNSPDSPIRISALEYRRPSTEADEILENSSSALISLFSRNIVYLGPLREDPKVLYLPAAGDQQGNVGKKGEKAIAILHTFGEDVIDCPTTDGSVRRCSLAKGVEYWLLELGLAKKIDTKLRVRLGLEPHLAIDGVARPVDLTGVGVGISQVLPVLVMGLHAAKGTVLLMEQPELHLHPALQQRLGDFLLACAMQGKQLIVETHSDHLVTRLRRRIAEDETDGLLNFVRLIFATRTKGRTTYTPVEVSRYGSLPEWPEGFFDQTATESREILRASIEKRKNDAKQEQSREIIE